jgi:putative hydrolase of HD superfamily
MDAHTILAFVEEIGNLKKLPRTGWRLEGIPDAESIADHCCRVALFSMILADALAGQGVAVDVDRVMRIALLHEIAEARITDIPYPVFRYLGQAAKEEAEKRAVEGMLAELGPLGEQYAALWAEFDEASTFEGRLVRAVDKLEMMVQVYEYEKVGFRSLGRFWANDWNRQFFDTHPLAAEVYAALLERRAALFGKDRP